MVVPSGEDVLDGLPFVEHIVHGIVPVRLWQYLLVCRHSVKPLAYLFQYLWGILLPPAEIFLHCPSVLAYDMLMFVLVKTVDKPDNALRLFIIVAVEEFPLHMLQAGQPRQSCRHLPVGGKTV